jgi:hypothetical protein
MCLPFNEIICFSIIGDFYFWVSIFDGINSVRKQNNEGVILMALTLELLYQPVNVLL